MKFCKDCKHCAQDEATVLVTGLDDFSNAYCLKMKHVWGFSRCKNQRSIPPEGMYHISDVDMIHSSALAPMLCGPEGRFWEAKSGEE